MPGFSHLVIAKKRFSSYKNAGIVKDPRLENKLRNRCAQDSSFFLIDQNKKYPPNENLRIINKYISNTI
jgi:hypothetical protein